jgi:hypothetical protein
VLPASCRQCFSPIGLPARRRQHSAVHGKPPFVLFRMHWDHEPVRGDATGLESRLQAACLPKARRRQVRTGESRLKPGLRTGGSWRGRGSLEHLERSDGFAVRSRLSVPSQPGCGRRGPPRYLELVPKPSVQPALSRGFVENFVESCGFWPFSTKWTDKVHDKGPGTPFVGQALLIFGTAKGEWLEAR